MGIGGRPKDPIWAYFHEVEIDGKICAKCVSCGHQLSNKAARLKAHHEKCKSSKESQIQVNIASWH